MSHNKFNLPDFPQNACNTKGEDRAHHHNLPSSRDITHPIVSCGSHVSAEMLRRAGSVVAKRATDSLMTAGCFVAYAIDWKFEGQNLPTILKGCGASAATLKELKRIGWLD